MNCASLLLYPDRISSFINNKKIVNLSNDIGYINLTNSSIPTILISAYPMITNEEKKETITETLEKLITYFTDNLDPVNNSTVNFKYAPDFFLNSEDRVTNYFFLASLIKVSPRLLKKLNDNDDENNT